MQKASVSDDSSAPAAEPRADFERIQADLIALQRMALLGSTSAMAAHECNNLLTPVLAWAQDALDRNDPEAMRKALSKTVTLVQRATAITSHLLGVARPKGKTDPAVDSDESASCLVSDAFRDALATMARPLDRDGIELAIHVDEHLSVRASPLMIHQVLLNLLLNARKAMEGVRAGLALSARPDGTHVLIEIRDSGKGMSRDEIERRLNPFLSADDSEDPRDWVEFGLGLAVCRKIVRQHDASIQAAANEGRGCTFILRWPAA